MLSNLEKRYRGLTEAFLLNVDASLETQSLNKSLHKVKCVCIVASGNSVYPASYLQLILNDIDSIPPVFLKTPLEYLLESPNQNHLCILVSYGVKNIDSTSVLKFCRRNEIDLFLITGEHSMILPAVERIIDEHSEGNVISVKLPSQEKGFVSILGTTALFATCFSIACSLGLDVSLQSNDIKFPDSVRFDDIMKPTFTNRMILHGPLGRPAALALAGFHTETLSPLMKYDLKNVTHGVWRTLQDNGPYSLYVIRDTTTAPLADFLISKLGIDNQCIVIENRTATTHRALEAIGLYASALEAYGSACVERRERDTKWNPLFVNMNDYENCKGLISQFSIFDLASAEGVKNGS